MLPSKDNHSKISVCRCCTFFFLCPFSTLAHSKSVFLIHESILLTKHTRTLILRLKPSASEWMVVCLTLITVQKCYFEVFNHDLYARLGSYGLWQELLKSTFRILWVFMFYFIRWILAVLQTISNRCRTTLDNDVAIFKTLEEVTHLKRCSKFTCISHVIIQLLCILCVTHFPLSPYYDMNR